MDTNGFYTQKEVDKMDDSQVIAYAGNYGPSMIGKPLFERAHKIATTNPGGALGKAFFEDAKPSAPKGSVAPSAPVVEDPEEGEALSAEVKKAELDKRIAAKKAKAKKDTPSDRRAPEGTEEELAALFKALDDDKLPEEDRRIATARVEELTAPSFEVSDELKDQPTE